MKYPKQIVAEGSSNPVGVGLKSQHYDYVLTNRPALTFFEVHAENYMMPGGAHHRYLEAISEYYRLSFHGVGMSLGSAEGLNKEHLLRFKKLVEKYQPWLVSEHLAWSRFGEHYLNDLLPLPMTDESLKIVSDNIAKMQDTIGRQILVENPSSYMQFTTSTWLEVEFLEALAQRTGCGLLLDVNNVFVSGKNMGWDVETYLNLVPAGFIGEIHLAGHTVRDIGGAKIRIDDHGSQVHEEVWSAYERLLRRIGPRPTLIEWDTNIPEFQTLQSEADRASQVMQSVLAAESRAENG